MKIYILTDLEGPAMVSRFNQTREEGPQKRTAMKLLTWEVNAAIDGIWTLTRKRRSLFGMDTVMVGLMCWNFIKRQN